MLTVFANDERKDPVPKQIVIYGGEEYVITHEQVVGNVSFRSPELLHERPMKRRTPSQD